jgi:hypothetical protein
VFAGREGSAVLGGVLINTDRTLDLTHKSEQGTVCSVNIFLGVTFLRASLLGAGLLGRSGTELFQHGLGVLEVLRDQLLLTPLIMAKEVTSNSVTDIEQLSNFLDATILLLENVLRRQAGEISPVQSFGDIIVKHKINISNKGIIAIVVKLVANSGNLALGLTLDLVIGGDAVIGTEV